MAVVDNKNTYDKTEIDNMLKETKEAIKKEVDELISVGTTTPSAPTTATSTLAFTILKSETK